MEMVTLKFPALVSSTLSVFSFPVGTDPKFNLEAAGLSSARALTPVPLMARVLGVLEALLNTETVPVNWPTALGENSMFSLDCCPGARVMGRVVPGIVNPFATVLA